MRCLSLADALRDRGAQCLFVTRTQNGDLVQAISDRGHGLAPLPAIRSSFAVERQASDPAHGPWLGTSWEDDATDTRQALDGRKSDWLVLDHYALDQRWERAMRPESKRLMVIDDLADRRHECDILVDQNLGRDAADYAHLIPRHAKTLIGPQYALLRPEFSNIRAQSLARRSTPGFDHLLIAMGGMDKDNATASVLEQLNLCPLPPNLNISIVMGPHAPWLSQVEAMSRTLRWPAEVLVGVDDMGRLMASCDLAIGAAGGTAWERCCLGIPSFVMALADNQKEGAIALQKAGAAIMMRNYDELREVLSSNLSSGSMLSLLRSLSAASSQVTDGLGTYRIVRLLTDGAR
jgi:UDP-2,4-diacetamido-2,4,6-trideoxy-beta-L-altropyranose hydrolase